MFRHRLDEHPSAEYLVVVFAGVVADPAAPRLRMPYEDRLAKLPAHRLYVVPQIAPVGGAILDIPALSEFLDGFLERLGVPPRRTVACGSSMGGTFALFMALRGQYGHVVVGSPIVLAGDYVEDPFIPDAFRSSIAISRLRPVETDDDVIDELNETIPSGVRQARAPLSIDLFVGEADYNYPYHSDALTDACDENPLVTLRRTIVPDVTHQNMHRPFGRHMVATLRELIGADQPE
jgi:pimeloyl-ACP methyl ester carboxylesterase